MNGTGRKNRYGTPWLYCHDEHELTFNETSARKYRFSMAFSDLAAGCCHGTFGNTLLIPFNAVENTLAILVKPAAFGWVSFAQSLRGLSVPCVRTCRKCFPRRLLLRLQCHEHVVEFGQNHFRDGKLVGGLFPAAIIQRRFQPRAESADALVAQSYACATIQQSGAQRSRMSIRSR